MIDELDRLVDDVAGLNSKLVLLIGPPHSGKSNLLLQLAERRKAAILNVGTSLSRSLIVVPATRRRLEAAAILRGLVNDCARGGLLLMDNIEFLFDRSLQLNPLHVLKQHAHARRLVAAWPGGLHNGRLYYAASGHPERQDYSIDGLIPFMMR